MGELMIAGLAEDQVRLNIQTTPVNCGSNRELQRQHMSRLILGACSC